jgi:DHA1 family inner membrane transport protein
LQQLDRLVLRNVWLSSWVLSFSLLGDALLYVVLPVHADAFGVSMIIVGFLLAVNRIIRIFAYGLIAHLVERIGVKRLCLIAAATASISTFGYGWLDGVIALTLSRMLWGLSFAALLLVTLTFAAVNQKKTGTRIGISRSVEQIGPLLAMTGGAWLATVVGPRDVFIYLGIATIFSAFLALMLNDKAQPDRFKKPIIRNHIFPRPDSLDLLIFWMGAGIDGVFIVLISLMWTQYLSVQMAILVGGSILAARRLCEMIVAPTAGIIADKLGVRIPLFITVSLAIAGFGLVGFGFLILGSIALVLARAALGTLFPAAVVKIYPKNKVKALARNQTWRDIGAAAGPLIAGSCFGIISPELMHILVAIAFSVTFFVFSKSTDCKLLL